MPDIREPSPIKPIWPSRPERNVGKRKQREQQKREQTGKRQKGGGGSDEQRSHIDDFA